MKSSHEALERKVRELTVLHEMSQLLVSTPDIRDALGPVLSILHVKMGMKRGTITLLDPLTNELRIHAAHGLTGEETELGRHRLGEGVTGTVVETGEPMIVPQVGKEPLFLNRTGARGDIKKEDISFICVPIKVGVRIFGTLSADRLFNADVALEEDVRLLTIIASIVGQAIRIHRMMEDEANRLRDENVSLRKKLKARYQSYNIVGRSNKMTEVFEMIDDEISTLNLTAQAKLLRVLQEKEFERIGGTRTIQIHVRVIAATNKALEDAVKDGGFREDLYYRLNIFPIYLPPLRERKTDVILLSEFFLETYSTQYEK